MKNRRLIFLGLANFLLIPVALFSQTPKEAICAVCRITEGATKPEKVMATSVYQKSTYHFFKKVQRRI